MNFIVFFLLYRRKKYWKYRNFSSKLQKQHGIFNIQTLDYLTSEEDNANLLNEEKHAKELGIKGVPSFIINKKFVLYGAQTKESFINIFNSITDV